MFIDKQQNIIIDTNPEPTSIVSVVLGSTTNTIGVSADFSTIIGGIYNHIYRPENSPGSGWSVTNSIIGGNDNMTVTID